MGGFVINQFRQIGLFVAITYLYGKEVVTRNDITQNLITHHNLLSTSNSGASRPVHLAALEGKTA